MIAWDGYALPPDEAVKSAMSLLLAIARGGASPVDLDLHILVRVLRRHFLQRAAT